MLYNLKSFKLLKVESNLNILIKKTLISSRRIYCVINWFKNATLWTSSCKFLINYFHIFILTFSLLLFKLIHFISALLINPYNNTLVYLVPLGSGSKVIEGKTTERWVLCIFYFYFYFDSFRFIWVLY